MSKLFRRLVFLIRRDKFDRDLADEMRFHLEMKARAEGGTSNARYAAQRQFGNALLLREQSRDQWGWTLAQDLRYGARMLRKNPGFAFVAAATLALGIAVNSTIFSIFSGWLLKKPPVPDPDHLVVVVSTNTAQVVERGRTSAVDFLAWRDAARALTGLTAVDPYHDFSLTGGGEPERVSGTRVSANYFQTLGVQPLLGRTFLAGEDQPGRDHVAVLSHELWERRFASDPGVVGKEIALDAEKYVVIGVMPASFRQVEFLPRLWTPLVLPAQAQDANARDARELVLLGRLASGSSLDRARAEAVLLARRAEQNYPASEKGWSANVMTLQEYAIQQDHIRVALTMLMVAVVLVLLIACANIANLLLARAAKRQQEISIRIAIGAGRMRVVRQLFVESLLLAAIGGSAGLVLASWAIRALRSMLDFNEYVRAAAGSVVLDERVVAFTGLVSIGAVLLFGLAPAIRVSSADPQTTLRQGGRMGDLSRGWGRNVLVGSQIALAMLLVIGAGLIIKATAEDLGGDFGFDPKRVLTAGISLTSVRYREPARRAVFFERVEDNLRGVTGAEAVALADSAPFNAGKNTFSIQGVPVVPAAERPKARYFAVSPGYFSVLGIQLAQGRAFRVFDNAAAPHVVIVNRAFAEHFFPGHGALGRYIRIDHDPSGAAAWSEIVGVIGDIKLSYNPKGEDAQMFEPYLQAPPQNEMQVMLRAAGDVNALAPALRAAAWSVDPDQPIARALTVSRLIDEQQGGDYVFDVLLAIFGLMALVLAAVGIYGVISYAVAQRTHEIGIRMALGAHRSDVLRSVLGKGMLLAVVSATVGIVAAAPLPQLFTATLQGYRVHSLPIFVGVPLLLLLVTFAAIYLPARRAARVDPMIALRYE